MGKLDDFFSKAPVLQGNTPWADRYARSIRQVFHDHAARAPRTLQVHLGPSELGVDCHRQVAGKMAQLTPLNHVFDPWPSIRGTALHTYAEEAFQGDNERRAVALYAQAAARGEVPAGQPDLDSPAFKEWASRHVRWLTEYRVTPHPLHPGTGDLYDAVEESVDDHKFLGETSMAKVRRPEGPPRKYVVQMLLYARGFRNLGLPVKRVVLLAYPATAASLSGMYVWDHPCGPEDDELLEVVFEQTEYRRQWAIALITGAAQLTDVPAASNDDDCFFCPFFRPQSAQDNGPGCPGHRAITK